MTPSVFGRSLAIVAALAGAARGDTIFLNPASVLDATGQPTPAFQQLAQDILPARPMRDAAGIYLHGRIVDVRSPGSRAPGALPQPATLLFEACERGPGGLRWAGAGTTDPPPAAISFRDVLRIEHEVDSLLDLRWIFGNRDELLTAALGRTVAIGDPEVNALLNQTIDPSGRLGLVRNPGPPVPAPPGTVAEGWLVHYLTVGPPDFSTPQAHARYVASVLALVEAEQNPLHPLLREVEPDQAVMDLVVGAARCSQLAGSPTYERGRSRHFDVSALTPAEYWRRREDPRAPIERDLKQQVMTVAAFLCRLATIDPARAPDPVTRGRAQVARELGRRARFGLVRVLEVIAGGRDLAAPTAGPDAATFDAQEQRLREALASARTDEQRARLRQAQEQLRRARAAARPVSAAPALSVTPLDQARVALQLVAAFPEWHRFQDDGDRLVRALVGVAACGDEYATEVGQTFLPLLRPVLAPGEDPGQVEESRARFRTALEHYVLHGSEAECRFARDTLARLGYGDPRELRALLDDLVATGLTIVALGTLDPEDPGISADERAVRGQVRAFRAEKRRAALAALAVLGGLAGSSQPSDRALGGEVLRRIDDLRLTRARGRAGRAEEGFLDAFDNLERSRRPEDAVLQEHLRAMRRAELELAEGDLAAATDRLDRATSLGADQAEVSALRADVATRRRLRDGARGRAERGSSD